VNNAELEGEVATNEERWIDYTGWWRRRAFLTNCWGYKKKSTVKWIQRIPLPGFILFLSLSPFKSTVPAFLFCLLSSNQTRTNCIFTCYLNSWQDSMSFPISKPTPNAWQIGIHW